jgi:hypothetical protein
VAPPARIVHDMTSEQHGPPDAAHLDDDAEALEDPVHCGDAKHQHDLHDRAAHQDD